MAAVNRSVLVGYSVEQMRALVADIEAYPQFLPWCERGVVSARGPGRVVATLTINFHGVRESFTTENSEADGRIDLRLVSGPFRALAGSWTFSALGDAACKVEFALTYSFASRLLEKLVGPVFREITDGFVEAFVRRADARFGER